MLHTKYQGPRPSGFRGEVVYTQISTINGVPPHVQFSQSPFHQLDIANIVERAIITYPFIYENVL